jgi:hypothetical protein
VAAAREIEQECQRLVNLAANLMDAGAFEELAALFTEDGTFIRPSTYPDGALRGRRMIAEVLRERFGTSLSRHICTNLVVEVRSESEALGHSYFTHLWDAAPGAASDWPRPVHGALQSFGEYRDTFVLTAAGWRFAARVGRFVFRG